MPDWTRKLADIRNDVSLGGGSQKQKRAAGNCPF